MTQEALKLALEFIENSECGTADLEALIKEALREHALKEVQRLGQEIEQEPVAKYSDIVSDGGLDPRNTTPPQRKPLTDEQIEDAWRKVETGDFYDCVQPFARAIEAAHGIKENT